MPGTSQAVLRMRKYRVDARISALIAAINAIKNNRLKPLISTE